MRQRWLCFLFALAGICCSCSSTDDNIREEIEQIAEKEQVKNVEAL